jgi:hypothetical protein
MWKKKFIEIFNQEKKYLHGRLIKEKNGFPLSRE